MRAAWHARAYSFRMAPDVPDSPLIALLRQVPLFAELHDEALQQLARRCVPREAPAGTALFTTGE